MDIQEKLDLIHEQQQTALNLTPNEQKSKNLSSLYADVVSARSIKDAAPVNVNEAEKRYYKAKYGDSYEQRMASRYVKDARMLRQQMLQKHETQQHEMKQTLSYYESVRIYLKNIAEVQSTTLTKIKLLLDKIRMAEVNTNYRKSFYMEQEQKNLSNWIVVCNCFILSYVVIIFAMFHDKLTNLQITALSTLLAVVFILPFIINALYHIPTAVNVYTEWGFNPTESKNRWFFLVPAGMLLLWKVVEYFNEA